MGKREEKKQETRRRILVEAKRIFEESGFERAKTLNIAKAAGIAEGTIFNYFDKKIDILVDVIKESFAMDIYQFKAEDAVPDRIEVAVRDCLDHYFANVDLVNKSLLAVVFNASLVESDGEQPVLNLMTALDMKMMEPLENYIQMLRPDASDRELETILRLVSSSFSLIYGEFILNSEMTKEQMIENLLDCLVYVLRK